jgi:hypothetical protein
MRALWGSPLQGLRITFDDGAARGVLSASKKYDNGGDYTSVTMRESAFRQRMAAIANLMIELASGRCCGWWMRS